MDTPENIRNVSVIACLNHKKSTISDILLSKVGITARNYWEEVRCCDWKTDQIEKSSINYPAGSLYYEANVSEKGEKEPFLISLIDSSKHIDFSSEVIAALRVTDGVLVVVDCIEGVGVQTETMLRQAMVEKVRPVLMVNEIDRQILELVLTAEEIYQNFSIVIDLVNVNVSNYGQPDMGDLFLHPNKGNVAFGSSEDCWAFTLTTFARIYSKNSLLRWKR